MLDRGDNLVIYPEAKLYTEMIGVLSKEDVVNLSVEEIYDKLSDVLTYAEKS